MLFGLLNKTHSFQRFIEQVFRGLVFFYAYIDDVLIASSNPYEHRLHLQQVFQLLEQYGIIANPDKCNFGQNETDFLRPSN